MRLQFFTALAFAVVISTTACERKTIVIEVPPATPVAEPVAITKTLETARLGASVRDYEREPTPANHAAVKKALADLDGEIAELEVLVAKRTGAEREEASVKRDNLERYRAGEVARFTAAQVKAPLEPRSAPDARTGADKVGDSAERVGKSIEDAARKTGDAIKDAVRQ